MWQAWMEPGHLSPVHQDFLKPLLTGKNPGRTMSLPVYTAAGLTPGRMMRNITNWQMPEEIGFLKMKPEYHHNRLIIRSLKLFLILFRTAVFLILLIIVGVIMMPAPVTVNMILIIMPCRIALDHPQALEIFHPKRNC